jgi:hypothetical protein
VRRVRPWWNLQRTGRKQLVGRLFGFSRVAGSFVGAPGDYLGMMVDVAVASAQRFEASSA